MSTEQLSPLPPRCHLTTTHIRSLCAEWGASWCHVGVVAFECVRACVSFSCTLDSCSLYCLTSFLPALALPGALAAVISMFSFKSPWKRGMGCLKGEKKNIKGGER